MLSVYACIRGYDLQKRAFLSLSGLLLGMAMLIKPVALPFMLLLAIAAMFFSRGNRSFRRRLENLLVYLLPAVFLALVVGCYFYLHGALHDFLYWNVTVPYIYTRGESGVYGTPLLIALQGVARELLLPLVLSTTAAIWILARRRTFGNLLAALLLPAAWAAALLPGMNFPHYFIQLVPVMALLGGIGLGALDYRHKIVRFFVLPALVLLLGFHLRNNYGYFFSMSMRDVSMAKYGPVFVNSADIAGYVKERTGPDDYIFQWGFEPELYFLSGRRSPLPYIASTILLVAEDRQGAIKRLEETLSRQKPAYIVYQAQWAVGAADGVVRALLDRYYLREATIGYGEIFRLKE